MYLKELFLICSGVLKETCLLDMQPQCNDYVTDERSIIIICAYGKLRTFLIVWEVRKKMPIKAWDKTVLVKLNMELNLNNIDVHG